MTPCSFPSRAERRNCRIRVCRSDFLSDSADKASAFRNSEFGFRRGVRAIKFPILRKLNRRKPLTPHSYIYIMKSDLVKAASKVIVNQQILVNMVSRRVRQLCIGHRPLVEYAPGLRAADIALTEIANGKLTYESTFGQNGSAEPAQVVPFPTIIASKKKAKKAA